MELQEQDMSFNGSDESLQHHEGSDDSSPTASPHGSPRLSPTALPGTDGAARAPIQKRRRVTRACDECRRKKIKCDGKQPCTHCTVYSYECTYDQPSNRRRNATPQYVEALEARLKRADALLKMVLPSADLNDPNLELKLRQGIMHKQQGQDGSASLESGHLDADMHLESMVRATGQLELDEQGNPEYHGYSSGLSFFRKMRESLGDAFTIDSIPSRPSPQILDSPSSSHDTPRDSERPGHDLPPRDCALELCDIAVNDAGALMRFVHWPSFLKQFNSIYDQPPEQWGNEDNLFLPLLYTTLAIGCLFSRKEGSDLEIKGYENAIDQGFKYFRAARHIMDIADCRSLVHLQAIVFMIIFLQSSAKLSTCYAYIGIALRSALRMGLHRSLPDGFNPVVVETRKRVFWIIRKMDTYVGALLGLPHMISDEDIDQEYPAEVDDEFITEEGVKPQPQGRVCIMTAVNAHNDLVKIVGKIVRDVYPLNGSQFTVNGTVVKSYSVSYAKIVQIEKDLQEWQDRLPVSLRPSGDGSLPIIRIRYLLRMAYAHAQMMLYRPFLHYVSQNCKSQTVDKRSFACAAACVSVSRNIVHIVNEMQKRKLLYGAYWFTMYTTFFAILSLVFYAVENPENNASHDVLRVAQEGKDTLKGLARRSMAADRCTSTLVQLFEHLPEKLRRNRLDPNASRKRGVERLSPASASTEPTMSNSTSPNKHIAQPRRAHTYPTPPSNIGDKHHNTSPSSNKDLQGVASSSFGVQNQSPYGNPAFNSSHRSLNSGLFSGTVPSTKTEEVNAMGNLPIGDLSAMMFPSSDPFEYPNQGMAATQGFNQLYGDQDPSFSMGNIQAQPGLNSTNYIPMNPQFMYDASTPNDVLSVPDSNFQLFGQMPMYQLQGGNQSNPILQTGLPGAPVFGTPPSNSPIQVQNSKRAASQTYNRVPDVNIGQLLGDNEWAGSVDPSNMGGMASLFSQGTGGMPPQRRGTAPHSKLSYATSAMDNNSFDFENFGASGQTRWGTF